MGPSESRALALPCPLLLVLVLPPLSSLRCRVEETVVVVDTSRWWWKPFTSRWWVDVSGCWDASRCWWCRHLVVGRHVEVLGRVKVMVVDGDGGVCWWCRRLVSTVSLYAKNTYLGPKRRDWRRLGPFRSFLPIPDPPGVFKDS
jgi:hypothetical protein